MAKVKTPGLSKAEGIRPPAPLMDGQYEVRVESCEIKESDKSPCDNVTVRLVVIGDEPEQADGGSPAGRNIFHRIALLHEDHPSAEQWVHIGLNQLKDFLDAVGIQVKADGWDPMETVGAELAVKVKNKPRSDGRLDDNGNPMMDLNVTKCIALED